MKVPKIIGIETEYGIALSGGTASLQTARDLFEGVTLERVSWDYETESPTRDARGISYWAGTSSPEKRDPQTTAGPVTPPDDKDEHEVIRPAVSTVMIDRDLSTFLSNGARFYIDHAHPEYCTPECATAKEVVAYDKAGEYLLMQMVRQFNQRQEPSRQIILYKNSSDHQGHSYGCHENYLMAAEVYEELFNNRAHWLYAYLIPYLVSRQIFAGAGKVGAEQGTEWVDYQLSQRADFFECVIGLQTTHTRPIINTRDEPHANPARFRRLHVICGDANLAEWSTYLKVAVTQLVLAMLEANALKLADDVMLAHPVAAFKAISKDPYLKATVELEQGQRQYTALDIQKVFVGAARRYLDSDAALQMQWQQVWTEWAQVIDWLETKPEALDRRLDWRIKWNFLQTQLARKGSNWRDPIAREMDIKFHQLDTDKGFFYLLRKLGQVEELLTMETVEQATSEPPASTRAFLREKFIRQYKAQILAANWDTLTFQIESGAKTQILRLNLSDPTAYTRTDVGSVLENRVELKQALTALLHKSSF